MSQIYGVIKKTKPTRHVVFIGHLDHGKSTLLGKKN